MIKRDILYTEKLLETLEAARNKYKPEKIKVVFVAEAPPDSLERFFYYEDVKEKDYLFLGIIDVLYPGLKDVYLKKFRRNPQIKGAILNQLKEDGYYLLDLYQHPVSMKYESELIALNKLSENLAKICSEKTYVILIKANVYDIAYPHLKSKFNVIDKRISFPSTGHQKKFKDDFIKAINQII